MCTIEARAELPVPGAEHLVVATSVAGHEQRYQVPVLLGSERGAGCIGEVGGGFLHDGLVHHDVVDALLHSPERSHWLVPPIHASSSAPLGAEQSNTSVTYDRALAKFYRRLGSGGASEVQTLMGLSAVGSMCVPPLWAWMQDSQGSLGVVSPMLTDAHDGGRLAAGYAEQVADFTALALDLGQTVRDLHEDLRAAFGVQIWSTVEVESRVAAMRRRLDMAATLVPSLAEHIPRLAAQMAEMAAPLSVQRVHADLHLGQALHQGDAWLIIDFEGEPGGQEDHIDHASRDLAGVLRSFDYVARIMAPAAQATAWRDACIRSFMTGYGGVDNPQAMRAYLIDKAAYEVIYEARNRPDLIDLPVAALRELAGSAPDQRWFQPNSG